MTQTTHKPTADDVKKLREATGAGMLDCRNALVGAGGDFEAARKHLIDQGVAKVSKKAERTAKEGLVGSYIHVGGKVGVLVEINCETDFVARNDRFQELVRDIAMHVAAMPVEYVERADVPAERVEAARVELTANVPPGKPANIVEKIVDGKLNKWFEERVLVDQPFVKSEDGQTVGELIGSVVGILGEKIQVRRFAKFALGEISGEAEAPDEA